MRRTQKFSFVWPNDSCIHELFLEQATKHPNAPCLVCDRKIISYEEAKSISQSCASSLYETLSKQHGFHICILLPRSADLVLAILSILSAGYCYVPIDASDPEKIRDDVVNDVKPLAIITCEQYMDKIPKSFDGDVIIWKNLRKRSVGNKFQAVSGNRRLVYILYTSGTTGRPKGCQVEHRGLVKRILWFRKQFPLDPGQGVLLKTPITFGISEWELFWPLCSGAAILLLKEGGRKDPESIFKAINEGIQGVPAIGACFVPSMLNQLLTTYDLKQSKNNSLLHCIACGEALEAPTCKRFYLTFNAGILTNIYGPTEGDITFWQVRPLSL